MQKQKQKQQVSILAAMFVVGLILPVYAQGEYVAFPETVSISSSDLVPHDFILKAIAKQSGDVEKVSGFKLDPTNVISILEGDIISAKSTEQSIVFERAKAKSSTDSLFELQKTTTQGQQGQQPQQNNGFSIAGLAPGVYTLDIIAAKNNAKAAYEGILVIGQNAESQEVKQVVEREITEVEQDTNIGDTITIFQLPPNPQPSPGPSPSPGTIAQLQPGGAGAGPLIAQQPPQQQPAAIPSDMPPDGTPCTGVDNVDIGVYKNGRCTPETLPPEPTIPSSPSPAPAAPPGTIPSCILTADCPPSPPPQALAAQQQPAAILPEGQAPVNQPPSPQPSQVPQALTGQQQPLSPSSSNNEPDNGNEPDPCLLDPNSPECQIVDTDGEPPSGTESCPTGTEGTPPDCSPPVEPGSQPVDLASTDPNDPLFGDEEPGETGEGEEGAEDTDESEDTDAEELESGSESDGDRGDAGEEGGDEGDEEGGDEGGNSDQSGGDGGE